MGLSSASFSCRLIVSAAPCLTPLKIHLLFCQFSCFFASLFGFPSNPFQLISFILLLHFLTRETTEKGSPSVSRLCVKSGIIVWRWNRGGLRLYPFLPYKDTRALGRNGEVILYRAFFPRQYRVPACKYFPFIQSCRCVIHWEGGELLFSLHFPTRKSLLMVFYNYENVTSSLLAQDQIAIANLFSVCFKWHS